MVKSRSIGDGHPTFNRNPLRTWVEFPIPYYMEIMGVDRPDSTYQMFRASLIHRLSEFTHGWIRDGNVAAAGTKAVDLAQIHPRKTNECPLKRD